MNAAARSRQEDTPVATHVPTVSGVWQGAAAPMLSRFAILLAIATLLRMAQFGDPNIFYDEAFYFAAGLEMQQGAVPYVDIWDRKPWGHFALFALFASISADPLLYQVGATIAAAATALVIGQIARPVAGRMAALAAGIAYLLYLPVFGGGSGQSPVFYNLLIAGAALIVLRAHGGARPTGAAMLLLGVALTIKTSVIFECVALGLLAVSYRSRHYGFDACAGPALVWALLGALPTLAIAAGYFAAGHWDVFVQAMAGSNLDKDYGWAMSLERAAVMAQSFSPLILIGAASLSAWRGTPEATLLSVWTAAAFAGLAAVPNFYLHYGLGPLLPLAILAAPFFGRDKVGPVALAALAAMSLWLVPPTGFATTRASQDALEKLAGTVVAHGGERGLLVMDGPPMLYHASGVAPLTPLWFPPHLHHEAENDVSHLDTGDEIRRILALHPGVVTMNPEPMSLPLNPETEMLVRDYVARNCRLIEIAPTPMRAHVSRIEVHGDCRED